MRSSSGWPCYFTWSCSTSSSVTCGTNATQSVPANSVCAVSYTSSTSTSYQGIDVSLSSTTLTIAPRLTTSASATMSGTGVCT